VNSATVIVVVGYNVAAVVTMIVFNLVLPQYRTPRTYYSINGAVTALAVALILLLQLVTVAHTRGHLEAATTRSNVEHLVRSCDSIREKSKLNGWNLNVVKLSEQIRFSEGLRRDPSLAQQVADRLARLEYMTDEMINENSRDEAQRIVREVESLAGRNS